MNFRFLVVFVMCFGLLSSCSQSQNKAETSAMKGLFQNLFQSKNAKSSFSGIWSHEWTNLDGYTVYEFIVVNPDRGSSFSCVLNPMGGLEYAPVRVQNNSVFTTFIDPEKNVYVNQLSAYGRTNTLVQLEYSASSDALTGSTRLDWSTNEYTRLSEDQKVRWHIFQSTCANIQTLSSNVDVASLKIEKLENEDESPFVSVLQTSTQPTGTVLHYCVFNPQDHTVMSLPVTTARNGAIAFSNLDLLTARDRATLFKSVPTTSFTALVPESLLATCSALLEGTRALATFEKFDPFNLDPVFDEDELDEFGNPVSTAAMHTLKVGDPTTTYLSCKYKDVQNGSNAGWTWAEYPRWEWETQKQSCKGLFANNCIQLNGTWSRDDQGLFAIGTMFIMDTDSQLESDFSRVCRSTNALTSQKSSRAFAQYHVADASYSFNHNVWFKQIRAERPYAATLPFERVVAFGDSLSDNGNLYTATAGIVGAGGYYQGRFSNGHVWVEYLSQKLKLDLYNWAVAAAPSSIDDPLDYFKPIPYTLQNELKNFTAHIENVGVTRDEISKMLFTVLFGGNNFIHDVNGTPERVSRDTIEFVDNLVKLGAKSILVGNLPDLSLTPRFNTDPDAAAALRTKIVRTNELLAQYLGEYSTSHPDVTLYDVNLLQIFDEVLMNPDIYHLKNLTDACYTGSRFGSYDPSDVCDEPENYLFWDEIHPSTTVHCQAANLTLNDLFSKNAIPKTDFDFSNCVASQIH